MKMDSRDRWDKIEGSRRSTLNSGFHVASPVSTPQMAETIIYNWINSCGVHITNASPMQVTVPEIVPSGSSLFGPHVIAPLSFLMNPSLQSSTQLCLPANAFRGPSQELPFLECSPNLSVLPMVLSWAVHYGVLNAQGVPFLLVLFFFLHKHIHIIFWKISESKHLKTQKRIA